MHRKAPRARTLDRALAARQAKNPSGEASDTPTASEARDSQVTTPPAATPVLITPAPAPAIVAPASAPVAAHRAVRRTPLRRMPTELVLTTRMLPVRLPEAPVQPVCELSLATEPEQAPFDRRPTAPIPHEAVELIEIVGEREAALLEAELAQTVVPVRQRHRTPVPPPATPVTAVARYAIEVRDPLPKQSVMPTGRHVAAQQDTSSGELATAHAANSGGFAAAERRSEPPPPPRHIVPYGPAPMHRADATGGYAPAALRHAVDTYAEQPTRHASVAYSAAPRHRADAIGGYAPAALRHPVDARAYDEQPTRHASVARTAAPRHRADATGGYAPAALRHAVDTRAYDEQPTRHASVAYTAAPRHRADATGGYAPASVHHADFAPAAPHHAAANGSYQPTPPRRASSTQWRAANLSETEPDGHHTHTSDFSPPDDDLTQVRQQLSAALESARKHEQRAKEAELRASWAERYVPQLQDPELEQRTHQRQKRLRWIKRVLEISCVGLALGGYISLLVPVRERVIAQDAMIHQLTTLQQQLREEKRALLQRIEEMQSGSEATTPP